MLDRAEQRGDLTPDQTILEPSSGNTGSELARLASARGYEVEIVMPDDAAVGKVEAVEEAARRPTSSTQSAATTPLSNGVKNLSRKTPGATTGPISTKTLTTPPPMSEPPHPRFGAKLVGT